MMSAKKFMHSPRWAAMQPVLSLPCVSAAHFSSLPHTIHTLHVQLCRASQLVRSLCPAPLLVQLCCVPLCCIGVLWNAAP